jgi:glycine cleavage system aminomethyltransferase T
MVQNVYVIPLGHSHSNRTSRMSTAYFAFTPPSSCSISGPGATRFMEHLVPSSMKALTPPENAQSFGEVADGPFLSSLSLMLNRDGGIIDDLMITRQGEER